VIAVPEILPALMVHAFAGGIAGAVLAALLSVLYRNRVVANAVAGFFGGLVVTGPLFLLQLWLEVQS
jgi:hypothetical protein